MKITKQYIIERLTAIENYYLSISYDEPTEEQTATTNRFWKKTRALYSPNNTDGKRGIIGECAIISLLKEIAYNVDIIELGLYPTVAPQQKQDCNVIKGLYHYTSIECKFGGGKIPFHDIPVLEQRDLNRYINSNGLKPKFKSKNFCYCEDSITDGVISTPSEFLKVASNLGYLRIHTEQLAVSYPNYLQKKKGCITRATEIQMDLLKSGEGVTVIDFILNLIK
jgi:hypothetical protein